MPSHDTLLTTNPRDTTHGEVEAMGKGGSARVQR